MKERRHTPAHHSAGSAAGAARAAPRLSPAWAPHRHQFTRLPIYLCELCALQPSPNPQQHASSPMAVTLTFDAMQALTAPINGERLQLAAQ